MPSRKLKGNFFGTLDFRSGCEGAHFAPYGRESWLRPSTAGPEDRPPPRGLIEPAPVISRSMCGGLPMYSTLPAPGDGNFERVAHRYSRVARTSHGKLGRFLFAGFRTQIARSGHVGDQFIHRTIEGHFDAPVVSR